MYSYHQDLFISKQRLQQPLQRAQQLQLQQPHQLAQQQLQPQLQWLQLPHRVSIPILVCSVSHDTARWAHVE